MTLLCMWDRFLDSLDSPGGHIAVLVALLVTGGVMTAGGVKGGEEVVSLSLGALFAVLRATTSNHARQNGANGHAPKETV